MVKPNGKLSSPTHPLEKHGSDASDGYLEDRVQNELINSKRTGHEQRSMNVRKWRVL